MRSGTPSQESPCVQRRQDHLAEGSSCPWVNHNGGRSPHRDARRSLVIGGLSATLAALGLAACAPEIKRTPVELRPLPAGDSTGVYTFTQEVTFTPATGYPRTIATGSKWRLIGRISSGEVYRPMSGVFTVESAQVHEAGIVIWQGKLTGFYMLVERSFVPLDQAVAVQLIQGIK